MQLTRTGRILILSLLMIGALATVHNSLDVAAAPQSIVRLGTPERISVGTGGLEANGSSFHPYASADGRYVGFISLATNMVTESPKDNIKCLPTFQCIDVFLRDRVADTTIRLSTGMDGKQANNTSFEPQISADGSLVHFASYADDIVPNDTNNVWPYYGADGFLYRQSNGSIRRTTLNHDGSQVMTDSYSWMPQRGDMIYFQTDAEGVVPGVIPGEIEVYRYDFAGGAVTHIPVAEGGARMNDTLLTLQSDATGRFIVFMSTATNVVQSGSDTNGALDVFIHDTQTGTTKLVSKTFTGGFSNGESGAPMISPNGTHVVFRSSASNLVPNDTNGVGDVFLYDIATEALTLVSVSQSGAQGNGESKHPAICDDAKFIAFATDATNFVAGDNNGKRDVVIVHRESGEVVAATTSASGAFTNGKSHKSRFIDDCSGLLYATDGDNMVLGDTNNERDLFYRSISVAADLSSSSQQVGGGSAESGDTITFTVTIENSGGEATTANYLASLPNNTTFVGVTAPSTYNAGTQTFSYSGTVAAQSSVTFQISVQIDTGLTDPTAILLSGTVTGNGETIPLTSGVIVNGVNLYLPLVQR